MKIKKGRKQRKEKNRNNKWGEGKKRTKKRKPERNAGRFSHLNSVRRYV